MNSAEENLEPATVTLIAYRGIGLQPPKGKKKTESKKAKWKVLFCHGQDKKMSTAEVISQDGNPVWDTTATITVGNSYEPLVLLLHYRDAPVGQVIIPWTQVPDKSAVGQPERLGELEAVRKNPEPAGAIYYSCWIDTYRPVNQQQQQKKPPGLLQRLSLSRSKLSVSSASIAEDTRRQQGDQHREQPPSRKAAVPTVKKLKRRLFNRGSGKSNGKDVADGPNSVSKAVSMGNLSGTSLGNIDEPAAAAGSAYSPTPSPSASPASLQRHPMARPHSLHNLALDQPVDRPAELQQLAKQRHQQQPDLLPSPNSQLNRSRSAACLFAGPTYPSVDTDRPLPEVHQMEPSRAPALGGQHVVVRGVALALSASDLIGASLAGVPCRAVAFISPEEVLLTAGTAPPAGASGPVELVTVSAGCVRSEEFFTYTAANAKATLPPPNGGIARSPSLSQLPFGSAASGTPSGASAATVQAEIHHARSSSLEASAAGQLAMAAVAAAKQLTPQPKPAAASSKSPAENMKKSRSVWDLRLGRRGSDASDSSTRHSAAGGGGGGGVKLRKRDSGKGTLSKKQLLQETENLRAKLEAANIERQRLTEALMEAQQLAIEAEQRAMEAEARARLDAESHEDRLLELTNFIDSMQARIIESGHVELLEKSPPRQPRC